MSAAVRVTTFYRAGSKNGANVVDEREDCLHVDVDIGEQLHLGELLFLSHDPPILCELSRRVYSQKWYIVKGGRVGAFGAHVEEWNVVRVQEVKITLPLPVLVDHQQRLLSHIKPQTYPVLDDPQKDDEGPRLSRVGEVVQPLLDLAQLLRGSECEVVYILHYSGYRS